MNTKRAKAMIEIGASSKGLHSGLAEAKKKVARFKQDSGRFLREVKADTTRPKQRGGGGLGAGFVGGLAAGALGTVTNAISNTAGEVTDLEEILARFQIAAARTPTQMAAIRASLDEVSRATAVNRAEIMAGVQTYVDLTGDADAASAAMKSFARISQASGASVADVATATAALKESMALDSADIETVFSGLIMQGKAGAVSLKDLASELSVLAPKFAKFGGSGVEGIADLGAAFQVARKGFGTASEAATGLEALWGALAQNAGKFEKANVKIFNVSKDGTKTFKSFVDIIDQIGTSKLAKDPTLLSKAFGSKEAAQAYDMLSKNRGALEDLYKAGLDNTAVQKDLDAYMGSTAGKLKNSFNEVKLALAEAFTPERIQKFADIMMKVAEAAGWIVDKISAIGDFLSMTPSQQEFSGALVEGWKREIEAQGLSRDSSAGKAALGARAQQWRGDMALAQSRRGVESDDEAVFSAAAKLAAKEAGVDLTARDPAREAMLKTNLGVSQSSELNILSRIVAEAVIRGMGGASVTVKMDQSAVAKSVDNAAAQRQPVKR